MNNENPNQTSTIIPKQSTIRPKEYTPAEQADLREKFEQYLVTLNGSNKNSNMPFISLVLFRMNRELDLTFPTAAIKFDPEHDKYTLVIGVAVLEAVRLGLYEVVKGFLLHEILHWSSKHFSPDAQRFMKTEMFDIFKTFGMTPDLEFDGNVHTYMKKMQLGNKVKSDLNIAQDICNNELVKARFKVSKADFKKVIKGSFIADTQEELDEVFDNDETAPGIFDVEWIKQYYKADASEDAPYKYYYDILKASRPDPEEKEDDDKDGEDEEESDEKDDQEDDSNEDEKEDDSNEDDSDEEDGSDADGDDQEDEDSDNEQDGDGDKESDKDSDNQQDGDGNGKPEYDPNGKPGNGTPDPNGQPMPGGNGNQPMPGASAPNDSTFHLDSDFSDLIDDDTKDAMDEKVRNIIKAAFDEHEAQAREGKTAGFSEAEKKQLDIKRKEVIKEKLKFKTKLTNGIKGSAIVKRQTRLRPSRRIKGSYFSPKRVKFSTKLAVIVDTSGSQLGNINEVLNCVFDLALKFKYTVDVYMTEMKVDNIIRDVHAGNIKEHIEGITSYGGGGTDLTNAQDAINKEYEANGGDNVVCLAVTDGYTPWKDAANGWNRTTIQIMEANDQKLPNCTQHIVFESDPNFNCAW